MSMEHVNKPCTECGVPVLVHPYSATKYVKCEAHRGLTAARRVRGRRSMLSPFEPGLPMEDRQARAPGAIVSLHRVDGAVEWDEEMTLSRILRVDEGTGEVHCFAQGGSMFQPPYDPRRESGQFHAFTLAEVTGVR